MKLTKQLCDIEVLFQQFESFIDLYYYLTLMKTFLQLN